MARSCVRSGKLTYNGTRKPRVPSYWVRWVYENSYGPVAKGTHIHHTCGNGWCVEPTHLQALSLAEHIEAHRYKGLAHGFDETALAAG